MHLRLILVITSKRRLFRLSSTVVSKNRLSDLHYEAVISCRGSHYEVVVSRGRGCHYEAVEQVRKFVDKMEHHVIFIKVKNWQSHYLSPTKKLSDSSYI